MKTKIVVCSDMNDMFHGVYLISQVYKKNYPEEDGHKIFLVDRGPIKQITNFSDTVKPDEERELIFTQEDVVDELTKRKNVDSQLSIAKITRSKNAEDHSKHLIDWLLCR